MQLTLERFAALSASLSFHLVLFALIAQFSTPTSLPGSSVTIALNRITSPTTPDSAFAAPPASQTSPASAIQESSAASEPQAAVTTQSQPRPADGAAPAPQSREPVAAPMTPSPASAVRQPGNPLSPPPALSGLFTSPSTETRPKEAVPVSGSQSRSPAESGFQRYLLEHISQNRYHDKQYRFSDLKDERLVILSVRIQGNGTLVRAEVARSSGDPALDDAAIRSTLAASPFRPPPTQDAVFGFEYQIRIQYSPQ